MNITETNEMFNVFDRVKTWMPETRIALARKILETLESPKISEPPRTISLDQVFGILKTDSPPPNDKECAKIVEDERLKRSDGLKSAVGVANDTPTVETVGIKF